jgi:general secretion pathway protein D
MKLLTTLLPGALLLLLLLPNLASAQSRDRDGRVDERMAQADKRKNDKSSPGDSTNAEISTEERASKSVKAIPDDTMVWVNYDNAELKDVIKDMAEKTHRNFLVDPKISGKITLISPQQVTMKTAYAAFVHALDQAGYAIIVLERYPKLDSKGNPHPFAGTPSLSRILSAKAAMTENLEIRLDGRPRASGGQLVTQLVTLESVSADEVSKIISNMISSDGNLITYQPTNTLIITDSANNIRRLMKLIRELDISAPKQELDIIKILHAEAQRVVDIINELYGTAATGSTTSKTSTASDAAARRAERRKARRDKTKKTTTTKAKSGTRTNVGAEPSFIGKMIADERTNSIIVMATKKALVEIRDLVKRIDYETDPRAQADIRVIYLSHAKAEELAQTLNNLLQASNARNQTSRRTTNTSSRNNRKTETSARANAAGSATSGNFTGDVRIAHDVATNSLVVTAGRDDFRRLRHVIDMLDIPRKQVFVETVIMEISDTIRDDEGVSWHGGIPGDTSSVLGAPSVIAARGSQSVNLGASLLDGSLLSGLALGIFGSAINLPIPGVEGGLSIPAFGLVIRALQEDTSTNVLSAPSLLTLDNKEASIEIGETVPFPTGGVLGGLGGAAGGLGGFPSVSFTREDVGIILRITPQVNDNGYVTMEIYQEISEVKEGSTADTLASGGPTTTKRSAETTVSVKSNQTIVIGGLMQEVESVNESKVPILGDIPLIGFLFRNKAKTKRKTNLLIFLTPHIIERPEDLQEVYRIKMLQRQEFMRRFYGKTKAEQREELNKLIRYSMNLPGQPSEYSDRGSGITVVPDSGSVPVSDEALLRILDGEDDQELLITPDGEMLVGGEGAEYEGEEEPPFEVEEDATEEFEFEEDATEEFEEDATEESEGEGNADP